MNITDINAAPLHLAYNEVSKIAEELGVSVTGTEIIGLVPKRVLIEAGKYYAENQGISATGEQDFIDIGIKSMGLDDLRPFEPQRKVIEYLMEEVEND